MARFFQSGVRSLRWGQPFEQPGRHWLVPKRGSWPGGGGDDGDDDGSNY